MRKDDREGDRQVEIDGKKEREARRVRQENGRPKCRHGGRRNGESKVREVKEGKRGRSRDRLDGRKAER